ncbi:MAG: hypothetical protein ACI4DU_09640, partial [Lachnospiraceae bacterium]
MKEKFLLSISILLFPATMLLLLSPLEIYATNLNEFNFSLHHFIWIFWGCSILFVGIGGLLLSLLPKKANHVILSVIFAGSVMAYLQNMFLNRELSKSDGSAIEWSLYKNYTIGNTIVWIAIIGILIFLGLRFHKSIMVYRYASLFLSCVQLITMVTLLVQVLGSPEKPTDDHYVFAGKDQLNYAAGENVIVLILDHYDSDNFDAFYEEHAEEVESYLHDFTYYNNADSHYNFTFPSVVHMLTGVNADNSMTMNAWCTYAWENERTREFYRILHDNGYTCNIYSDRLAYSTLGPIVNLKGSFDNIVHDDPKIDYGLICRLLEKMSIYRYAPYLVKPRFEQRNDSFKDTFVYTYEQGPVATDNPDFYQVLLEQGLGVNSAFDNLFSVNHIQGLHGPCITGVNGERVEETDVTVTMQGISVILAEFIAQLKAIGVYDNAAIFLIADHGDELGGGPQPIFFLKLPGETHTQMQVNSAPISYDDFQATVLSIVSEDYLSTGTASGDGVTGNATGDVTGDVPSVTHDDGTFYANIDFGTSIFDWQPGDIRERELWYPYRGFYIFRYSTDREELREKIAEMDCEHVESQMKDQWRLMDEGIY